ncbi:MAG: class I SAM-dependent methyltransferase [Alphaproteobacteria bacterium]
MTEGFDADWLALREPADIAARSAALADAFLDGLPPRPRIMDLGAGTGSNARYLNTRAEKRGMRIDWVLVDGDPTLLDRAALPVFDRRVLDFAADPATIDLAGIDAVSASALFDLVSEDWFSRFVALLGSRPLLAALTASDGHCWAPADPDDPAVEHRFAADMRRDKGFGPAMGLAAPAAMATRVASAGFAVRQADTPWRLGPDYPALAAAMIDGIAAAVTGYDGASGWRSRRHAALDKGILRLTVGHRDLLAMPQ